VPLACGGPDAVSNLQWQTIKDARRRTDGSGGFARVDYLSARRGPSEVVGAPMTKRGGVTLRLQRVNGVVRSATGTGQYMVWEIAR
jgi:hypothetical protein